MTELDIFILGLVLGGTTLYFLRNYLKRRVLQKRIKRAQKGEKRAVYFLENNGYQIQAIQESKKIITWIDNKPYENKVIVDFIVSKHRKKYIVEVKTGYKAVKPTFTDTRRQLLEYLLAFQPDGILLLDMESRKLQEISFEFIGNNGKKKYVYMFLLAGLLGLALGYFLFMFIR